MNPLMASDTRALMRLPRGSGSLAAPEPGSETQAARRATAHYGVATNHGGSGGDPRRSETCAPTVAAPGGSNESLRNPVAFWGTQEGWTRHHPEKPEFHLECLDHVPTAVIMPHLHPRRTASREHAGTAGSPLDGWVPMPQTRSPGSPQECPHLRACH